MVCCRHAHHKETRTHLYPFTRLHEVTSTANAHGFPDTCKAECAPVSAAPEHCPPLQEAASSAHSIPDHNTHMTCSNLSKLATQKN